MRKASLCAKKWQEAAQCCSKPLALPRADGDGWDGNKDYILRCHPHLVKMFRGDAHSAIKPADRPSVKADAIECFFVVRRGKELVLLYERQTIEDALTDKGRVRVTRDAYHEIFEAKECHLCNNG